MKKTTLLRSLTTWVCNLNVARRAYLWTALGLLAAVVFVPSLSQAAVTEAWVHRYNNVVSNSNDHAVKVVRDPADDIIVTGSTDDGITGLDMLTIKYSGANGSVLWQQRYNGPENSGDFASAVAVDGSGNVIVSGVSAHKFDEFGFLDADYYTAKYAAADGALLWEQRYNGPANQNDVASAVAVESSGNVVVTGTSYNTNYTNSDYYTAKYAAADGALLWEQRYNGPANSNDGANAVAVDGSGNVVVTGYSYASSTSDDYYTVKYAAGDGAVLWEKRSYGGGQALAVDGSGNVVVTGSSWNGTNADYYTAKYAAADGALLWEKRYNGPANGDDKVDGSHSLALGPNGMVAITGSSSAGSSFSSSFDYATVVYRENLPPVSIALVPTGVRLRFTGVPGRSYTIGRAPAVTGPWSTINTQTAPASGLLEYLDAPPPPGSAFYRTAQP